MPTDTSSVNRKRVETKRTIRVSDGAVTFSSTIEQPYFTEYDSRTYVQSRRRPKGFMPPKPYTREVRSGCFGRMSITAVGRSSGFDQFVYGPDGGVASGRLAVPPFDTSVSNRALMNARAKMKSQTINFGVAFAEAAQTAGLVASTAGRIARAYTHVRHGNIAPALNELGVPMRRGVSSRRSSNLSENWLELQYGWKPLLSDVYGAAEEMARQDVVNPNRYRYHFKGASRRNEVLTLDNKANITDNNHPAWFSDRLEVEHAAFVRLDVVGESSHLQALARRGFTNPSEIFWEKIPFSFVVDWFLPVGDYLNTIDSGLGWDFLAGSLSTRLTAKGRSVAIARPNKYWSKLSVTGADSRRYMRLVRTTYSDMPFPRLIPKSPLSLTHMFNSLALLTQAVGRK